MSEKIIIPISIIISAVVIGGAIMFSQSNGTVVDTNPETADTSTDIKQVDPLTDHIIGNPEADLFIIEYSDLECPFCKRYHDTIQSRLVDEYAEDGRIAFVFRHFPLDAPFTRPLHPTATEQAVAAECVAQLAGNDAFFTFIDDIFATTNSDGQYDLDILPDQAVAAGADREAFVACYESRETQPIVTASFTDGQNGGVEGTPAIFAQDAAGNTFPGVADYTVLKQAIEIFLEENPAPTTTEIES